MQVKLPYVDVTARIEKAEYTFDTYADDWYANIEAQAPKAK